MIALQANVFQSEIEASNVVPPIVAILVLPVFIVVFLKVRAHKGFDLRQRSSTRKTASSVRHFSCLTFHWDE